MADMREWVVGFLIDGARESVVLIRKNRPEWQRGKLNGVGGKIEPEDLSIADAMVREFYEETGRMMARDQWHHFASLTWEEGIVHFLRSFNDYHFERVRTVTDEHIERHKIHTLGMPGEGLLNVTPNLLWLVPLAAHRHDTYDVIDVVETGTTLRKPGRLGVIAGSPLGHADG